MTHTDPMHAEYSYTGLVDSLKRSGLRSGDIVYVVAHLEKLGVLAGSQPGEALYRRVYNALREVVGEAGTIVVPTYTFSFCRRQPFDVQQTPSVLGPWSPSTGFLEYVRHLPGAQRSADPIHSVAAVGPHAAELVSHLPATCFGAGSLPARLKAAGARLCALGVGLHETNFQHHVEETVGVPFRFRKLFSGHITNHGVTEKKGWLYNVGILAPNGALDEHRLEERARSAGVCVAVPVGSGEILGADCQALYEFTADALSHDPWLTAVGPAGDPVAFEKLRVAGPEYDVQLPAGASLSQMIDALWQLPRHIVSEGYDAALRALAGQLPMTIHEYPTGTECWSWFIPEKWTCYEAYLETKDGRRLFSYAENPLHAVSYSLPFEGEVSREELFAHLHVHPRLPEAVPFIFKYYERDWGLCCSQRLKDSLTDDTYRVVIRSDFSYGTLKVGEVVAPGRTEECIVLCAHLCHPAMVNDDLAGVVVGMKVMEALLARRDLHYTYKFLILPETIGSVAYLSQNEALIPTMKGGLFLEMLGIDNPHALQLSLAGDTEVDRCFSQALKQQDPAAWVGAYRTVIGNDERQFNGPGVRVPMLSLSRVLPPSNPDWPYLEYHSSDDTPAITSLDRLEASVAMVLGMIDTLEKNLVPVNRYKGEIFCSRYGMSFEEATNPEAYRALFSVMDIIDGTRSVAQIAARCNIAFDTAYTIVRELHRHGLVELAAREPR